tara:strand:+ start:7540 stop:8370 length:831 start_codon:yes stop_codon:yes gene_type:complete
MSKNKWPTKIDEKNLSKVLSNLRRPFVDEEVFWRAQTVSKNGSAMILAYVDSRAVQQRLDDALGPHNWQTSIKVDGPKNLAGIGILINGDWVWKWDGAGDTAIESSKGGISDAIKRACVLWGMARHLYDLPTTWSKVEDNKPNVPGCRQVFINDYKKGIKGYATAPSIREIQAHLISPADAVRHIEDPKARRIQRFVAVAKALSIPKEEIAVMFEAASCNHSIASGFTGNGVPHPTKASEKQLLIASHRIIKWYDEGLVLERVQEYQRRTQSKEEV